MTIAFSLEGASLRYDDTVAIDDVTLAIDEGECVGLIGPSGAGKTSLLHLLGGIARPTAGRVVSLGQPLAELSRTELQAARARIGTIHQDLALVPSLRVAQNVLAGRLARRGVFGALRDLVRPARDDLAEVHALLERVGIAHKLFERVDRLSGGEQQRVALARALYQQPRALLADEPVSSVDPARARDLVALLTQVAREEGLTLCFSLHDVELARAFLPRLIGLRAGRVVFDRPSEDVGPEDLAALYALGERDGDAQASSRHGGRAVPNAP